MSGEDYPMPQPEAALPAPNRRDILQWIGGGMALTSLGVLRAWATRAEGHELPAGMQPVHPTKISPLDTGFDNANGSTGAHEEVIASQAEQEKAPAPILIDVTWLELLLPSIGQKVGGKVVIKPLEPNGDFPVPNESSNDANSTANLLEGSLPGDPKNAEVPVRIFAHSTTDPIGSLFNSLKVMTPGVDVLRLYGIDANKTKWVYTYQLLEIRSGIPKADTQNLRNAMNLDVPGETELEAVTCSGEPQDVGGGYYTQADNTVAFFGKSTAEMLPPDFGE
ncbi:MAG TPA: hypothetical protein PK865_01460 [Candidatus Saccharibacteria bacterium]|nr:hypothetical protein [Candidatus Saccharibacteria bacterium]